MRRKLDLTGEKYGRLTVIKEVEPVGYKRRYLCKCVCGNEKIVKMNKLRDGTTKSCGCYNKERVSETQSLDLTGKTFGKLTVLKRSDKKSRHRYTIWECQCECGNKTEVKGSSLMEGVSTSCGCNKKEHGKEMQKKLEKTYRKDGVLTSNLISKLSKDNTSGFKGVSYAKDRKKYRAYITIKKKQIKLGDFNTLEEAVEARRKAEETYHQPYIKAMEDNENEND